MAVGGVVHLEDEVGVGGNEFCHAIGPVVGRTAGGVDEKHVTVSGMGLVAKSLVAKSRGGEGRADRRLAQPARVGRTDVDNRVMDVGVA